VLAVYLPDYMAALTGFSVRDVCPLPSGTRISWDGTQGWIYRVQYRDALTPSTEWKDLPAARNLPGVNGKMTCTDTNTAGVPLRVYRVLAR